MQYAKSSVRSVIQIPFDHIIDATGTLHVAEKNDIKFNVERIYTVECSTNSYRGNHAHKLLSQLVFCTSGTCEFEISDQNDHITFTLNPFENILIIPPGLWRKFKRIGNLNCTICVLADRKYEKSDYISCWKEFLDWKK